MAFDQKPFGDVAPFTDNPERRCAVVLLLDTSTSMGGAPITQLNAGVQLLRDELRADLLAAKRVELAIVTFGPVRDLTGFVGAESFVAPVLDANGDTPIGAAIQTGIDLLADRKQEYRNAGVGFYRPWIILITDGAPTDDWKAAARLVHQGEADRAFSFYAIGVEGASMDVLNQISPPARAALKLKGLSFKELFLWLSNSLKAVSSSKPGEDVRIANPTADNGWGTVAA